MLEVISTYWPQLLALVSAALGTVAAVHAAMTKRDVRSAISWVGIIVLSPVVGALIYAVAGINRMRRATFRARREIRRSDLDEVLTRYAVPQEDLASRFGGRMGALAHLGQRLTRHPVTSGNRLQPLTTGDEAYGEMIHAIDDARFSILMETYIFDRDAIGLKLADCLIAAVARGVEVRVLIDAVGARYSVPSIVSYLLEGGVRVASFNGKVIMGVRLPYANLRTHRKILVVDGSIAFIGGMNIRAAFTGPHAARDTHFKVTGPEVVDIYAAAADDWHFETGEVLGGEAWRIRLSAGAAGEGPFARTVLSGPDAHLESNHRLLMGAFSVAERSIKIMSPYFLPDNIFLSALATAARRGVSVEIVVPSNNNLAIVSYAMLAQFEQILRDGSRIFRARGAFNHSKLLVVDDKWSFVGSSNLDSRSLRLNFEIDLEVYDEDFARFVSGRIDDSKADSQEITLELLQGQPFLLRLVQRIFWLGSPYL